MLLNTKTTMADDIDTLRRARRENFLRASGFGDAALTLMPADASFRRYYRVTGADRPMLMLEDPPEHPSAALAPYREIGVHLRALGLHAPEIYHADAAHGLLLIEDFGDDTYTRLFARGEDQKKLYERAVDALVHLHRHPQRNALGLAPHTDVMTEGAMLLLDWYYPALTGKKPTAEMAQSFAEVWDGLIRSLPADQTTLVLRDYHVDNLMRVPGEGVWACGLLDFQDARTGQFSYDLMSLLEDARHDVPQDLQRHLHAYYLHAMGADIDRAAFEHAFRILAAQRHARVLGIFVRLSVRDGKDRYLQFIPHVRRMFLRALAAPALTLLQNWFEKNGFDIARPLPS